MVGHKRVLDAERQASRGTPRGKQWLPGKPWQAKRSMQASLA